MKPVKSVLSRVTRGLASIRGWWRGELRSHTSEDPRDPVIAVQVGLFGLVTYLFGLALAWIWSFDYRIVTGWVADGDAKAIEGMIVLLLLSVAFLFVCLFMAYVDLLRSIFLRVRYTTLIEVYLSFLLIIGCITIFAKLYQGFGIMRVAAAPGLIDDFDYFYFSVVTWTTLGFGDIVPLGTSRHIVVIETLVAFVMNALFLASIVSLVESKIKKMGVHNARHHQTL